MLVWAVKEACYEMVVQRPQLPHPATPILSVAIHDLKCLDFLLMCRKFKYVQKVMQYTYLAYMERSC